jgi:predicted small secreted protein
MRNPYFLKNMLWACIIGLFLTIILLSGCSTVSGLGSDIKGAADWTHEKITKSSVELNK